jgi:glycosyltransferase involved in cell wall biosynthesis
MHIVFLSPHSDPLARPGEPDSGGQCIYEHQLAIALSKIPDIRVTTYCRQKLNHPSSEGINLNYNIERVKCGPDEFVPKEKIEPYINEFTSKVAMTLKASKEELVFHGHYWDGAKSLLQMKEYIPHATYIWTPHSLGYLKRKNFQGLINEVKYNFLPRLLWENYVGMLADKLIVSTESEKNTLTKLYMVNSDKIDIVPPGVQIEMFRHIPTEIVRKKHDLPMDAKILLCLGRITEAKGYHHAIKALKILKRKYKKPVYLVIWGGSATLESRTKEETKYLARLKSLSKRLKVSDYVIFRPSVTHDKVNEVYSCADVLLITSENEPFGITVLEAMAMKVPVVSNFGEGPKNLIIHNQTGCLVNIDHLDRYANYVLALLLDDYYKNKIINNAYNFILNNFDWDVRVIDYLDSYKEAIVKRKITESHKSKISRNYFLKKNLA